MRAFGLILFLGVLGATAWAVVSSGNLSDLGGEAPTTELAIANEAGGEIRDLDAVVGDALENAERALRLAAELDAAASEARAAAESLASLAADNDAARPSAEATRLAAEDAEEAAIVMRRYAEALQARFRTVDEATEDAEAIAGMAIAVEERQAEAERAAAEAQEARARMRQTEAVATDLSVTPVRTEPVGGPLDGEIVILREEPAPDEDVQRRLDEIFPDDVIEYDDEDGEIPYGERG